MRLAYGLRWRARKVLRSLTPRIDPRGVAIIQSADAAVGTGMLAQSARTCSAYANRHGYAYKSYVGVRHGFHPWQACFNRVFQMMDLLDEGFRGWVFHIDADATIVDLGFDLRWIIPLRQAALIASPSGTSAHAWDLNSGVFLLNLGSPDGRTIVERWHRGVMDIPEQELRDHPQFWGRGDQRLLHLLLQQDPALMARALRPVPPSILHDGVFVKHYLRATGLSMAEREEALRRQADAVLGSGPEPR